MTQGSTQWVADIATSVDQYNRWYAGYTKGAFNKAMTEANPIVNRTFSATNDLRNLSAIALWRNPIIIRGLRMSSSPTWAVDRLIGLSQTAPSIISTLEKGTVTKQDWDTVEPELNAIIQTIKNRYDLDLLPWLATGRQAPTKSTLDLAKAIITDRLALSIANPAIRNAQEAHQLRGLEEWLAQRGYQRETKKISYTQMKPGTYRIRVDAEGKNENGTSVKVSVDTAIMPKKAKTSALPVLVECKAAGDFTNVNKRRKEEADKHRNLIGNHGENVRYVMLLFGYFDTGYLGYETDAGIPCFWQHRLKDLANLGL